MAGFINERMFQGLQRVLDVRQAQHAATAANIANAETPGYRAKVIDFNKAIEGAFEELGSDPIEELPIIELEPPEWAADGNSVDAERETARLQANSLMYRAVSTGISKRFAMLKYAANDGR